MSVLRKFNRKVSSRQQINIKAVDEGVLTLPGNHYRLVLQASSINFELKSEAEQDVLIETYQSFLNSLGCPLQILIRVREMDMNKYLEGFRAKRRSETEEIYQQQISHYTAFVSRLVTRNKILARQFYVIIPFESKGPLDFDVIKEQLALHADIVSKGLGRLGMQARQLTSLEVLDLFYSFYNPRLAKIQPITEQTLELLKGVFL